MKLQRLVGALVISLMVGGCIKVQDHPDEHFIQGMINARLAPTGGATDGMAKQAMVTRVYNLNCATVDGAVACQWDQDSAGGYTIKGKTAKFVKGQQGWFETR